MRKSCIAVLVSSLLAGAMFAQGDASGTDQNPAPAQTAAPAVQTPAPAASPTAGKSPLTQWGTDFSFMFDGYVSGSFNKPDSRWNQLRNFDFRTNSPHVNMGMISIDRAPAPVGFHLDVGFGEVFNVINTKVGNRDPEEWKYFKQAYVTFKPKGLGGVQIDAGKFVTSAGAEVIEANQNWNYSRSLLFAWAIPYWHFGFRATVPVGKFTGGFQVLNGWNNIQPLNSGKTYGFLGSYAWKKVTWFNNYYTGPQHRGTTEGWRNLYDTTVLVNHTDSLSYYINFDYGRDKNIGPGAAQWVGLAGAMRYAIKKNYAIAARLEFFDDMDGFSTGVAQRVKEFTFTGEYKPVSWLIARAEFRNDWSDQPYFEKKNGVFGKNQPTVLFGLVAYITPKK